MTIASVIAAIASGVVVPALIANVLLRRRNEKLEGEVAKLEAEVARLEDEAGRVVGELAPPSGTGVA